jgi:hypothetical protein
MVGLSEAELSGLGEGTVMLVAAVEVENMENGMEDAERTDRREKKPGETGGDGNPRGLGRLLEESLGKIGDLCDVGENGDIGVSGGDIGERGGDKVGEDGVRVAGELPDGGDGAR